jgi:2',3'-cyclic-nucleotide 2'-phosphodiesterase/3'-nucleotidase
MPYVILKRMAVDDKGKKHPLRIGVIGFVTPQIMEWDKANLEGKVQAKSIVETAKKYVPIMKKKGTDVIVALAHTGISSGPYTPNMENAAYYLTQIEGLDAVFTGHAHSQFPSAAFKDLPNANIEQGTINGKPVVMAGAFGSHLGVVDLELQKKKGSWKVINSKASLRPITGDKDNSLVAEDEKLFNAIKPEHEATIDYVNKPVGETKAPIYSFFALVQDNPSVQIVNNAQLDYLQKKLKEPAYSPYTGIPVLSAAAPFKAGGRNGPDYYTDIPAGILAIKNVADLYVYPNTLQAVLVNGEQLKEWLEMSAGQFQTIDPAKSGEQQLINPDFRSYNFDVIDGVQYQIDVTKPPKYDAQENIMNVNSSRIVNLTYNGRSITPEQKFIVATNNYRASSKTFPGVSKGTVILRSLDENRQILTDYIRDNKTINPLADKNWSIAPTTGNATPIFNSSLKAQKLRNKIYNIPDPQTAALQSILST